MTRMSDPVGEAYGHARFPVPSLVLEAHRTWLDAVAAPGSWWTGGQRLEFISAVWSAMDDNDPLPPWVTPTAATRVQVGSELPSAAHDVAYRLGRHAGTCTEAWYTAALAALAVDPPAYVELVALAATAAAVHGFARGMAIERPVLPPAQPGQPDRIAPDLVPATLNWVPVRPPADQRAAVVQALHAVPRDFDLAWSMAAAQYMPDAEMVDLNWQRGVLHRRQLELVAARVSLIRECFF